MNPIINVIVPRAIASKFSQLAKSAPHSAPLEEQVNWLKLAATSLGATLGATVEMNGRLHRMQFVPVPLTALH